MSFEEGEALSPTCLNHPEFDGSTPAGNCTPCKRIRRQWKASRGLKGQFGRPATRGPEAVAAESPTAQPAVKFGDDLTRDVKVVSLENENARLRTAYKLTVKEQAQEERLIQLFDQSIARFPSLPPTAFNVKRKPKTHSMSGYEVPVLMLSDQQIGEIVSHEEVGGLNAYNFDIYQQRLEHLEDRVIDILTEHQNAEFKKLVIAALGDNISGVIHEELQKGGHQHIVDQVYLGAMTTALFVYRLKMLGGFDEIEYIGLSGNHGRLSPKKESKQYFRNLDYMFNNIVATALRGVDGITFNIPRSLFTVVDVANTRVLMSHGHELPPSAMGIPLYSINRGSAAYQEMLSMGSSEPFKVWLMGHFHRPLELDGSFVNGTMVGITEYGVGRFKPILPMQRLMGFHSKWGRAWEYPIRLDKAPTNNSIYTFSADMATGDAIDMFNDRLKDVA